MSNKTNFKQIVECEIIRASPLIEKLKNPVICEFCKNKRFCVIRCESCGHTEQKVLLKEKTNAS